MRFFTILNFGSNDLNIVSFRIDIDDSLQNILSISHRLGKTNTDTALVDSIRSSSYDQFLNSTVVHVHEPRKLTSVVCIYKDYIYYVNLFLATNGQLFWQIFKFILCQTKISAIIFSLKYKLFKLMLTNLYSLQHSLFNITGAAAYSRPVEERF